METNLEKQSKARQSLEDEFRAELLAEENFPSEPRTPTTYFTSHSKNRELTEGDDQN